MAEKRLLSKLRPDLRAEWDDKRNAEHGLSFDDVSVASNKKVWWLCANGHSFEQTVDKRTSRGYNCPYCSGKKVLVGFNDLQTTNPKLLIDWDYEGNTLRPSEVTFGSQKRVSWICHKCGHKWEAAIGSRTLGRGCPACAIKENAKKSHERQFEQGVNDLATKRPDLPLEWDYTKNIDKRPEDFACGSREKVWWKCSVCGHGWKASIANRANRNSGCPKCKRNMRTSFPEQALLFYIRHLFPMAENSYMEIFDVKQRELDIYIPEKRTGIEYDGVAWHSDDRAKKVGYEKYKACQEHGIRLIRISEKPADDDTNCDVYIYREDTSNIGLNNVINKAVETINGVCSIDIDVDKDRSKIMKQYIVSLRSRSIAFKYPEEAKEWDYEKNNGLTPEMVSATANIKYWWKCKYGHSYQSMPSNKLGGHQGCPICSNKRLLSGFNDLETRYPEIASEWDYEKNHPMLPSGIMPGVQKKYGWICSKGHSYEASPNNRVYSGTGCPYCAGKLVKAGFNDLETTNPETLKNWDYDKNDISPNEVSAGSGKVVWWKCSKRHSWQKRIVTQVKHPSCSLCENRELQVSVNDLATTNPELVTEWDDEKNELRPFDVTSSYNSYIWWKCNDCGTKWRQKVTVRISKNSGCPKCGYSKKMQSTRESNVVKNKKDLKTKFPEIAAEWDYEKNEDLEPSRVSFGSNKKVWWRCPKGHSYEARITDRTGRHKSGCPYCAGRRRNAVLE